MPHHTGPIAADLEHAKPHDHGPASRDHSHCPEAKPVDLASLNTAQSATTSFPIASILYPVGLTAQISPVDPRTAAFRLRHRLPPPLSAPHFLALRLLI
jgi:hypothetical protein